MIYMSDANGNLIPFANDNQGNESGKWVDGKYTNLGGVVTSETNIDMSTVISNFVENAEYEANLIILVGGNTNINPYIGSDLITIQSLDIRANNVTNGFSIIVPFKKYIKYKYSTSGNGVIYLFAYRRIK